MWNYYRYNNFVANILQLYNTICGNDRVGDIIFCSDRTILDTPRNELSDAAANSEINSNINIRDEYSVQM